MEMQYIRRGDNSRRYRIRSRDIGKIVIDSAPIYVPFLKSGLTIMNSDDNTRAATIIDSQ